MEANVLPHYEMSDNPTGCCPRFHPEGWDYRSLHFRDKRFVRAKTRSIAHIPLNMGKVFRKTFEAIEAAEALDGSDLIVMSHDRSAWSAEHFFAVAKDVPGQENVRLNGDYVTKVFEGPYKEARHWCRELEARVEAVGKHAQRTYFFYTTCPKCAKAYGKNYVVGVTQVA